MGGLFQHDGTQLQFRLTNNSVALPHHNTRAAVPSPRSFDLFTFNLKDAASRTTTDAQKAFFNYTDSS